jgi:hypothetical protein
MPANARQTAASNPPPSSRAAGKQPMSYTPASHNSSTPTTTTSTRRSNSSVPAHSYPHTHPTPPPSSNAKLKSPPGASPQPNPKANSKIWSTSSVEERERIKEFWLGLAEDERRNLVKIEKDTVLKKMKEQQKHSCSCAVCGRKRFVFFTPPSLLAFCKFLLTV